MRKSELITALLKLSGDPYVVFPCLCEDCAVDYHDVTAVTLMDIVDDVTDMPVSCAVLSSKSYCEVRH